jgi:hypothetical protein
MFKHFFSSLVLVATVVLYGCGGGGGGGGGGLNIQLVSIVVTPATPSVAVNDTLQLTATGTYTDNSTADLTASVTWTSSDTLKATIASGGIATGKIVGTTTVTATSGTIVSGPITLTVNLPLIINTLAGSSGISGNVDATGAAARFNNPNGVTTDGTNLYVADTFNHAIRQITQAGVVTTVATLAPVTGPIGITTDGTNLYVAESLGNIIRKIEISTGNSVVFAGSGTAGSADGTGTAAQFNQPMGIAFDGTNLYVADYVNRSIRKMDLNGVVTTLTGSVTANPIAITVFGNSLYVAADVSHVITEIDKNTGVQTLFAGAVLTSGTTDGTGPSARFKTPTGITTDGTNLYVIDNQNSSIRKIEISTKKVTTVSNSLKDSNTLKSFGALGISMFGTSLCTSNNDHTITLYSGGIIN